VQPGMRGQVDRQTMVALTGVDDGTLVVAGTIGPLREGTLVRLASGTAPN
jgi:multidrug efflux system membrane fusion protein